MSGRPAKSLEEHVRDGSFRPSRHAGLLDSEPLVSDRLLRPLQERFRAEPDPLVRQVLAVYFGHATRGRCDRLPPGLLDALLPEGGALKVRPLEDVSFPEHFYASAGCAPAEWFRRDDGSHDFAAERALERRWRTWNRRHGLAWRVQHFGTALDNVDVLELCRPCTGEATEEVRRAAERLPELVETFLRRSRRRKPIHDPPNWDRFRT